MGLNISICYKDPELFLKGDTILNSDVTCYFQKWLQLHPSFTLCPALGVTCQHTEEMQSPGTSCRLGGPLPLPQLDSNNHQIFFPSHCHLPSFSMYEWRIGYMQGRKAKLTQFWKSGSWVRATLSPSGIYECFTTHPVTIWHFGDYNHPLFILCSRSLWDLNESWRIQSDDNKK